MRITQSMLTNQSLSNLNNNLNRIQDLDQQLSTGKKINKLSDDPVGLSFSLRYKEDLAQNEQFKENIDYAKSKINHTESAINEVDDILQRARELAVQGANDTNSEKSRNAIAAEIHQLYEQLVDVGNSQFNGEYIFNGQLTNLKTYEYGTAQNVTPNQDDVKLEVGKGIALTVNISGSELFGEETDANNAFKVLNDLEQNLLNDDTDAIGSSLGSIDESINTVIDSYAKVGAVSNRADLINSRLEDENINLQKLISETEDADLAEVITNLNTAENVYKASLQVTADIIQTSLLDFLR